jgi:hypothetical protein
VSTANSQFSLETDDFYRLAPEGYLPTHRVPYYLSSDNDPLFLYHRWQANLRILNIQEIKSVPNVPLSHPFVERLIGTLRRERLDHILFWNACDLERKLEAFRQYYNDHRVPTWKESLQTSKSTTTVIAPIAHSAVTRRLKSRDVLANCRPR